MEDADVELLQQASCEGGTVVSNDRFVDHLKMPNLDGVTLVGWVVRGDSVLLQERSLERLRSAIISARSQKQKLKDMGLAENSPELAFRWYCREPTCGTDLIAIPAMSRGSAVCPTCGAYLDKGAPWQQPLWLKLMHGQEEVNRFVLEDGESIFVGRARTMTPSRLQKSSTTRPMYWPSTFDTSNSRTLVADCSCEISGAAGGPR